MGTISKTMFRAIGFLIILWGLSNFFSNSFAKMDETGVAVLGAVITASQEFENNLEDDVGLFIPR